MCNPNSTALAYRRQRAAALASSQDSTSSKASASNVLPSSFASVFYFPNDEARFHFSSSDSTARCDAVNRNTLVRNHEDLYRDDELFNSIPVVEPMPFQHPSKASTAPKTKRRRRKPQQPGKTAKQNDRHFVIHNYHDHANDGDDYVEPQVEGKRRGGVSISFPMKLHAVLDEVERDGLGHVVSWQAHGRCFVIHKPKEFTEHVMPHYFRQTKLTSFQRQLNLYGFLRLSKGIDAGGYYHELFLRGKEFLCKQMVRTKVKGTRFKAASSPDNEPDFYKMAPVTVTPASSDCDNSEQETTTEYDYEHRAAVQEPTYEYPVGDLSSFNPYSAPLNSPAHRHVSQQLPVLSPMPVPVASLPAMASPSPYSQPLQAESQATASNTRLNPQGQPDTFIDQTVDELFLDEADLAGSSEVRDSVMDFVSCWDPSLYGPDAALENDTQLGNLLEKLLWDEI